MAFVLADRVKETTITTGTGSVALLGSPASFVTFGSVMANTDTTYYVIADPATADWEVGVGTYDSVADELARTTIIQSSNADALVSFATGTKDVFISYPADKSVFLDTNDDVLISNDLRGSNTTMKIGMDTADGSDSKQLVLTGGGGGAQSGRGAYLQLNGNEFATEAGLAQLISGSIAGAEVRLQARNATGLISFYIATTERMTLDSNFDLTLASGNLKIGTAAKGIDFNGGPLWNTGSGTPEGSVTAVVGSLHTRTDGGASTTLYIKESGSGNTGWRAV